MALPTVGTIFQLFFLHFCQQKKCISFRYVEKNDPERMSGSSQTYLFHLSYNTDPSTMVTSHLKNMRFFC